VPLTATQIAALKQVPGIYVGCGWQDPGVAQWGAAAGLADGFTGTAQEVTELTGDRITVTPDFINGGHEWYVWRILLRDFLTRVAFHPSIAALSGTGAD
jgi:hypothetical protein